MHPDKCSCFGAEGAFQLISRASTKLQAQNDDGGTEEPEQHSPTVPADPSADWTMPNAFAPQKDAQNPRPFASPVSLYAAL